MDGDRKVSFYYVRCPERGAKSAKFIMGFRYSDVEEMMAMRQATFSSLSKRIHLRLPMGIDEQKARHMEAKALIGCCKMARKHEILQHALSAATQLNNVVEPCKKVGLDITSVATLQSSNVLWEHGQAIPSIRMLQALVGDDKASSQAMVVGKAKLLAKLVGF
jgi:ataxia telangiectasia mutated family protein